MRSRLVAIAQALAAVAVGLVVAAAVGSAGASTQTVTLGSTSGTPSQNICVGGINCTYVPFLGVSNPELQVPFDGTVTSFSVNAGSSGNTVRLRVLRPASGGQFTGVGTSPAATLAGGVTTFAVSLPVKAGDVLALDNADSALMFDTSTPTPIAAYYQLPSLADGQTAAPNNTRAGYRLLLSAKVQAAGTTTTSTTSSTGPPVVSHVAQTHRRWREGTKLAQNHSAWQASQMARRSRSPSTSRPASRSCSSSSSPAEGSTASVLRAITPATTPASAWSCEAVWGSPGTPTPTASSSTGASRGP